jgi:hypothetical protein
MFIIFHEFYGTRGDVHLDVRLTDGRNSNP